MFATSIRHLTWITLTASMPLLASCKTLTPWIIPEADAPPIPSLHADMLDAPALPVRPAPDIHPELYLAPPEDLWARLRRGFELDHRVDMPAVQTHLRWFDRHPNYLMRLSERLQTQMPHIVEAVQARGLPLELALLPIVESALDAYAFSPTGAAGVWQFMPATGRRFGLPNNSWYDGRRDLDAATEAALDYLTYLHKRFGSWPLAVAGYNAGEGNVNRALRRSPTTTDVLALPLPTETKRYVPRLLALSAVVADPERTRMAFPPLADEKYYAAIDTESQLELAAAAEALEVPIDKVYRWNPQLESWSTPPNGPHRLNVPRELMPHAQAKIDALAPEERLRWRAVTVAPGDTLDRLAARYHTDVDVLRTTNGVRGSLIRVGQTLMIPTTKNPSVAPPNRLGGASHTVTAGESLWQIARDYRTSISALRKKNRISRGEPLRVGQVLYLPGSIASAPSVHRTIHYRVRRGDSLSRIAGRFSVKVSQITRWNALDGSKYLQPGQKLRLRVPVVGS